MTLVNEGLKAGDLEGVVSSKFSIDQFKSKRDDEQSVYNKLQSESFQIAAEIARAEKDIEYTEQIETSKKDNIEDINQDIENANVECNLLIKKQSENEQSIIDQKKVKEKQL